jgi:uncharacterized protein YndB with AHSA1/START domain
MPSYEVVGTSRAPVEQVWALLADAATWSQWAGPMIVRSWWEREGTPPPGGVGAIRGLGLKRLGSREEIVEFDPPHHLAYTILSGLPVHDYRADVELTAAGAGTSIVWRGSYRPKVPGTGAAINAFLHWTISGFVRRLARAAEK